MEVDHATQCYLSDTLGKRQSDKELQGKCSGSEDGNMVTGCFDCNICLDYAAEPVVTLCGHLYCWPCIYRWLQVDSMSSRQCPVCKGPLSQDTLVPLYGRGGLDAKGGSEIPLRSSLRNTSLIASVFGQQSPSANEMYSHLHEPMQQFHHHHQFQYSSSYASGYMPPSTMPPPPSPFFHSMAGGALGGLATSILPWLFRNHELNMYYSSPYHFSVSANSPRLRRQQMEVMSSLHQIWFFLFCCVVLCLLFF